MTANRLAVSLPGLDLKKPDYSGIWLFWFRSGICLNTMT